MQKKDKKLQFFVNTTEVRDFPGSPGEIEQVLSL